MRRKRSRLCNYGVRARKIEKDREGTPVETFEGAFSVEGEIWPAGGRVQAEVYGERLQYVRNLRIAGRYTVQTEAGAAVYQLENGCLRELDGVCVDVSSEEKPDFRIIAVKPYRELLLELERIL